MSNIECRRVEAALTLVEIKDQKLKCKTTNQISKFINNHGLCLIGTWDFTDFVDFCLAGGGIWPRGALTWVLSAGYCFGLFRVISLGFLLYSGVLVV